MSKGPGPYVNTVPKEGADPLVKVVPFDHTAIGANGDGMPKGLRNNGMGIDHVGGTTKGA